MWLATRRLGVVPQAALKRPLPAGSTLLYKRPASDMDSAVHVAKWQFRYGITGVIVGFSSAMWAVSLPPPLLGLGGAALAAQLFLGVRASTRVLEVQRARFVTQLTAHIEETQAASDREPYTSVSEGLQGTPRLNLEYWGQAAWTDIWNGALMPPPKSGSCAFYIEKLMKPDAHVNMDTLGKVWTIMAKQDDDQIKETLAYLAGYLRRDPIRQFKTITILYGMQAHYNKKLFSAMANDEGWIAALAFIRSRAESGLNEEGDPLMRAMTAEIEKRCIERDNVVIAFFKGLRRFVSTKFGRDSDKTPALQGDKYSDSGSTHCSRKSSIDEPEDEPSSQPLDAACCTATSAVQTECQPQHVPGLEQPSSDTVTMHPSSTEAPSDAKPMLDMTAQTAPLDAPNDAVPVDAPDEALQSAPRQSGVPCDVPATKIPPAPRPSAAVCMEVSEAHMMNDTSSNVAATIKAPIRESSMGGVIYDASTIEGPINYGAPSDVPPSSATFPDVLGDDLV